MVLVRLCYSSVLRISFFPVTGAVMVLVCCYFYPLISIKQNQKFVLMHGICDPSTAWGSILLRLTAWFMKSAEQPVEYPDLVAVYSSH